MVKEVKNIIAKNTPVKLLNIEKIQAKRIKKLEEIMSE